MFFRIFRIESKLICKCEKINGTGDPDQKQSVQLNYSHRFNDTLKSVTQGFGAVVNFQERKEHLEVLLMIKDVRRKLLCQVNFTIWQRKILMRFF